MSLAQDETCESPLLLRGRCTVLLDMITVLLWCWFESMVRLMHDINYTKLQAALLNANMRVEDGSCMGTDAPGLRHHSLQMYLRPAGNKIEINTRGRQTRKPLLFSCPRTCYGSLIVTETVWPPSERKQRGHERCFRD